VCQLTMVSLKLCAAVTMVSTVAAFANAYYTRKQFYPASMYMVQSKTNLLVRSRSCTDRSAGHMDSLIDVALCRS